MAQPLKPVSGATIHDVQKPAQSGKLGDRIYTRQTAGSPPPQITRAQIPTALLEDLKRRWSKGSPNGDDQKTRERAKSCSPSLSSSPEATSWDEIYSYPIFNDSDEFQKAVALARKTNCSDLGLEVIYQQIIAAGLLVKADCTVAPRQAIKQCLNENTIKRLGGHRMKTLKEQLDLIQAAIKS